MSDLRHSPTPEPEPNASGDAIIGRAVKRTLLVVLLVGGVVALSSFLFEPSPVAPTPGTTEAGTRSFVVPAAWIPKVPFVEIGVAAGIDFVHTNGAYGDKLLPETMGLASRSGTTTTTATRTSSWSTAGTGRGTRSAARRKTCWRYTTTTAAASS